MNTLKMNKGEIRELKTFTTVNPSTKPCEECDGEGKVSCDEFDRDSGQMMAGVGEQDCICQAGDGFYPANFQDET